MCCQNFLQLARKILGHGERVPEFSHSGREFHRQDMDNTKRQLDRSFHFDLQAMVASQLPDKKKRMHECKVRM
jgi:hypothetical protein